jgi:hypothetical protein
MNYGGSCCLACHDRMLVRQRSHAHTLRLRIHAPLPTRSFMNARGALIDACQLLPDRVARASRPTSISSSDATGVLLRPFASYKPTTGRKRWIETKSVTSPR